MITKLYIQAQQALIDFKNDQRGVTAIEYAVLAVAVSAAVYTAFGTSDFSTLMTSAFTKVTNVINGTK